MATIVVGQGSNLDRIIQQINNGDVLEFQSGVYKIRNGKIKDKKDIAFKSQQGAVITCPHDDGLSLFDIDGFYCQGIRFLSCGNNGVYAEHCNRLWFEGCTFGNNQHTGLLTAYCNDVTLLDILAFGSKEQHGVYLSSSGDNYKLRGGRYYSNKRGGLQINAVVSDKKPKPGYPKDSISKNVSVEGIYFADNKQFHLQFAGVQGADCHDLQFCKGRKAVTLWDDDSGKYFTTECRFYNCEFVDLEIGVQIGKGSHDNQVYGNKFRRVGKKVSAAKGVKYEERDNREES